MAIKLKGAARVEKNLKKAAVSYTQAMSAAIYQKGLEVLAGSVRLVPVDTGRLRSTHYVTIPSSRGVVEMGYGTDYAVPVHERTDVRHTTGQAKFLEQPVNAARSGYAADVARKAQNNFKSGVGLSSLAGSTPTRPKPVRSE